MAANFELARRLRALWLKVRSLEFAAGQCGRELELLIESPLCRDQCAPVSSCPVDQLHVGRFVVDRATFSVSDGSHVCKLGNTVCFRFVECLANEPNRFFTRIELLAAIWDGQRRSPATVRSAVFDLRAQFRRAGLDELADAIRSDGHAYGLRIKLPVRLTQRKTNGRPNGKPTPK